MPILHTPVRRRGALSIAAAWLLFGGCGGDGEGGASDQASGAGTDDPAGAIRVAGFSTPESVLYDPAADVYLVSNINGSPLDQDGNGFISRVTPEGEIAALKWIDGEAEGVTLSAPKGMALLDGVLYVSDIDCIRGFDRETGAPAAEICVEGATFLNDIAVGPNGELFVSDTGMRAGPDGFEPSGSAAIHRMSPDGRQAPIVVGDQLGVPNGLAVGPRGLFMVSFGSGQIFQVGVDGSLTPVTGESERQLDGIEFLPDGSFLFSSWGDQGVFLVGADGVQTQVASVEAPADIGYDATRNRVLIPLFMGDEILIVEL
jgi:hypothetical protein